MKFIRCISALLLPVSCVASPTPGHGWADHSCLADADAAFLVDVMISLSVKFDPGYVTQFMTEDFALQSDSFVSSHPIARRGAAVIETLLVDAFINCLAWHISLLTKSELDPRPAFWRDHLRRQGDSLGWRKSLD